MLRKMTLAVASTVALATAPAVWAQSGSPQASTETGSEVASQKTLYYETNSPAVGANPAMDTQGINMPLDVFKILANARGEPMVLTDGTQIGVIQEVDFNLQGNPELVVEVGADTGIPADRLIVTVLPDNFMMAEDKLMLDTSLNELILKAEKNSIKAGDRVEVTIF